MSEESTQTNISSLADELPTRQHPLPWILFGITAVLLAIVGGLLAKKLSLETRRANEAIEKSAGLKAQLDQQQKYQAEADKKVADAEAKTKEAEDATIEAAAKVKKAEAERDKAVKDLDALTKKTAAAAEKEKKEQEAAAKKDAKSKKKKKRR